MKMNPTNNLSEAVVVEVNGHAIIVHLHYQINEFARNNHQYANRCFVCSQTWTVFFCRIPIHNLLWVFQVWFLFVSTQRWPIFNCKFNECANGISKWQRNLSSSNEFNRFRQGFPGSQPVSMDITNYMTIVQSPYRVSWKADGTR